MSVSPNITLFPGGALNRDVVHRDHSVLCAPHAWKLIIPVEGTLGLTLRDSQGSIPAGTALLIRQNTSHCLHGGPLKVAFHLEPELCQAVAPEEHAPMLLQGRLGRYFRDFGRDVLQAKIVDQSAVQSLLTTTTNLLERGGLHPRVALHPRVEDALQWLRRPWLNLDHKTIAKRSGISSSHLSHLLKEQLGISGKRYSLWARSLYGIQQLESGASVTETAARAGFYDVGHFSRSVIRFFGVRPSFLAEAISVISGGVYGLQAEAMA